MKETITITRETQDYVWLTLIKHPENKKWHEYQEFRVFENLDNAREYIYREVTRMGVNAYTSYDNRDGSIKYFSVCEEFEADMFIKQHGKVLDEIHAYIYKETIN